MKNIKGWDITRLEDELDDAIARGDIARADAASALLFTLRGGNDADAVMPENFPNSIETQYTALHGGRQMKSAKKFIAVAAAAILVVALGITALATGWFGVRDLVISTPSPSASAPTAAPSTENGATTEDPNPLPTYDIIALQGFPDSPEYKASAEWNTFCAGYDQDGAIINEVGNSSNEYTERYPMYLVYSKDMADKLEEIITKYDLTLHTSRELYDSVDALMALSGTGNFIADPSGLPRMSGYVYDDGTFHYDGEAVLSDEQSFSYQFGNYVKGTFSDVYLNVGDADGYDEWTYETSSGITVSLALGETKSLLIAELDNSFVTVNILNGARSQNMIDDGGFTQEEIDELKENDPKSYADKYDFYTKNGLTREDLEAFADLFDFSVI